MFSNFRQRFLSALPKPPDGLDINIESFVEYNGENLTQAGLSSDDVIFLSTVGLPEQPPPYLHFFIATQSQNQNYSFGVSNSDNTKLH